MKTLQHKTAVLLNEELMSIPEKYQRNFASMYEGLGVLREEYVELEQEIFFGEKIAKKDMKGLEGDYRELHKNRVRKEAIQVAAMAVRIIQELT